MAFNDPSVARKTRHRSYSGFDRTKRLGAHRNAIKAGAAGVVLKDQAAEALIKAIEKVNAGEVWMTAEPWGICLRR